MSEQDFNAKERLEEGVTLLDLVEKCPRRDDGRYIVDDFRRHTFTMTVEFPDGTRTYEWSRVTTGCKKLKLAIKDLTGKTLDFVTEGKGGSQGEALADHFMPDVMKAAENDPSMRDAFTEVWMKITPPTAATPTGDHPYDSESAGPAMADQTTTTPESVHNALTAYSNVIVEGVAGCGKSHLLEGLTTLYGDRVEVVVFHPSTSYEDFVSGLRPQPDGSFTGEAGVFVRMCERAAEDPGQEYLLFVDEINRANTSRVFGDLMLVLEGSKRADLAAAEPDSGEGALLTERSDGAIALQTPVSQEDGVPKRYLRVPRNLHILGTMNTTDRSVGTIDLALRRRFHWITMEPMGRDELRAALEKQGSAVDELDDLITWYGEANRHLKETVGPDARLGHSYFFGAGREAADVATGLLNQLKEVVATFNIKTADVETIVGAGAPVGEERWSIHLVGQGLGRRPEIVTAAPSSTPDEQADSPGEDPEETSPAAQG